MLFRSDLVTPMVSYLASEVCEPSHEIFGVAAGRFARIGIITHKGYVNTTASAEDIADNIEEIRNIENVYFYPPIMYCKFHNKLGFKQIDGRSSSLHGHGN